MKHLLWAGYFETSFKELQSKKKPKLFTGKWSWPCNVSEVSFSDSKAFVGQTTLSPL